MEKRVSFILGALLVILAVAGFTKKEKHFAHAMNIDVSHSVLRTPLAFLLLIGSRTKLRTTRALLGIGSTLYFAIGLLGLGSRKLYGFLPSKLTTFDLFYHHIVGAWMLWLSKRSGRMVKR